jgi:hypothetical protein
MRQALDTNLFYFLARLLFKDGENEPEMDGGSD